MKQDKILLYQRDLSFDVEIFLSDWLRFLEGSLLEGNYNTEFYTFISMNVLNYDTILFPEYFAMPLQTHDFKEIIKLNEFVKEKLIHISKLMPKTIIIAGTLLGVTDNNCYNSTNVLYKGKIIAKYNKRNLFGQEIGKITKGNNSVSFKHPVTDSIYGILICADVFNKEYFSLYNNCDYIAIPTFSPLKKGEKIEEQYKRDREIFVLGAQLADTVILKCCCCDQRLLNNEQSSNDEFLFPIQGRSLIATKDEVLVRAKDIFSKEIIYYPVSQ